MISSVTVITHNSSHQITCHGEKQSELRIKVDHISVGEDKLRLVLFLADKNDGDLLGGDRQHGKLYTIELVETTPRTRLRQTYQ